MDDPLLMRVLDRLADFDEEIDSDPRLQPFCWEIGGKTVEFQWILQ